MTVEEAISRMNEVKGLIDIRAFTVYRNACDMAIEALEKQIPKKVVKVKGEIGGFSVASLFGNFLCPSCKNYLDCKRAYCGFCGQSLVL